MAQLKSTTINGNLIVNGTSLFTGGIKFKDNHAFSFDYVGNELEIYVDGTKVNAIRRDNGDHSQGDTKLYTIVTSGNGSNYIYQGPIAGYSLVSIYNGDWSAAQYIPLGFVQQNSNYILFFNSTVPKGQPIRLTSIWRKND